MTGSSIRDTDDLSHALSDEVIKHVEADAAHVKSPHVGLGHLLGLSLGETTGTSVGFILVEAWVGADVRALHREEEVRPHLVDEVGESNPPLYSTLSIGSHSLKEVGTW